MTVKKPTSKASLEQAQINYISWGDFDFQLVSNNTFRPSLTSNNETEVITNTVVYKHITPKNGLEKMTIHVLYDPEIWTSLRAAKEAGTERDLETSDGFKELAVISEMGEVNADIDGPITDMPVTFSFPHNSSSNSNSGN